nr:ARID DNA-binding domain-containing protein [Tanacetum cinerariifolium]
MVNYKHILQRDWSFGKPVNSSSLHWYQSQRFKPWEKPIRNRTQKIQYSLKNDTTEIVPKSNQKRQLSNEGKNILKEKLKEIEAFNASSVCTTLKKKTAKTFTRREKRARCFICKERGHVLWKCPNKKNKDTGETSKPLFDEKLKEAIVETKDGTLLIPNVHYTPKITMNVLSIEQLENQGLASEYQEAVKECYKEFIGMVKIYYEEAKRSKRERPGKELVGNDRGTVGLKEPQDFAGINAEIGNSLNGTPKGTTQVDVKNKGNSEETTNKDLEDYTSSSDDFIVIT